MSLPKSIAAYSDIERVLRALPAAGGRIEFLTAKSATRWVARANFYRKLLREQSSLNISPYDHFRLVLQNDTTLRIIPATESVAQFRVFDPDGNEVDLDTPSDEPSAADIAAFEAMLKDEEFD